MVGTVGTVVGSVVGTVIFCVGSVHFVSRSFNFKSLRIDNDETYKNTAVPTTEPTTVRTVHTAVSRNDICEYELSARAVGWCQPTCSRRVLIHIVRHTTA